MMQFPVEKSGAKKSNTESMLSSMMPVLVEKSAVKKQLRETCSVAWCEINMGKEESKKILANPAQ